MKPVSMRGGIDERLEGRARLALRLDGAVELAAPGHQPPDMASTRPVWVSITTTPPETLGTWRSA